MWTPTCLALNCGSFERWTVTYCFVHLSPYRPALRCSSRFHFFFDGRTSNKDTKWASPKKRDSRVVEKPGGRSSFSRGYIWGPPGTTIERLGQNDCLLLLQSIELVNYSWHEIIIKGAEVASDDSRQQVGICSKVDVDAISFAFRCKTKRAFENRQPPFSPTGE